MLFFAGFAGQCSRTRLKQSWWNGLDRFWDSSGYLPKHLVTSCQVRVIRSHEVKKSNLKFQLWVAWCMLLLGQFFISTTQKWPKAPSWTSQLGKKYGSRENAEISGDSRKSGPFYLQNDSTRPFFTILTCNFCTHKPHFHDTVIRIIPEFGLHTP